MLTRLTVAIVAIVIFLAASSAGAWGEPPWSGQIVARGAMRARIESTDILHRPYRPLHFYGNTVRRRYYRGRALPSAPDIVRAMGAVVTRR